MPRSHATKHYPLSERIVLDNERCIMCTRCVRFTREISKTHALGVQNRGDHSLIRPVEDGAFENDPYSDNVIDICPVGALLSRSFLHKARVWYLKPTPSVCPGCERGCTRQHLASQERVEAEGARPAAERAHRPRHAAREPSRQRPVDLQQGRVTWRRSSSAPRAEQPMQKGRPVELTGRARQCPGADRRRAGSRWRWCRTGVRTRNSRRSSQALGRALHQLRQDRLAARCPASGSKTSC